ncbi:MAG: hypothetical protein HYS33_03175 [Acidobacteria bacterium]|nr:hypothetical protein [Acidobacteriota bacterium]
MRRDISRILVLASALVICLAALPGGQFSGPLLGKEKQPPVDPNDPTYRLFQLLDKTRGGKLADFYVIADVYKDAKNPEVQNQHILRAEYDKNRGFGKLNLHVRSVGQINPQQMEAYTPKDFYEFGLTDLEKFLKTEPGPLGKPGDVYLRTIDEQPLHSTPVTDDVRKSYELYLIQYLLPALEKK